jgi:hypothetical protein
MAIHELPTFEDPFYTITMTLDGQPYVFDFRFNQREESWYVSISLEDGTELTKGIKILCGVDLLWRCVDHRKPPGLLTAISSAEGDKTHPRLDELGPGKRVTLFYFDKAEIGV